MDDFCTAKLNKKSLSCSSNDCHWITFSLPRYVIIQKLINTSRAFLGGFVGEKEYILHYHTHLLPKR